METGQSSSASNANRATVRVTIQSTVQTTIQGTVQSPAQPAVHRTVSAIRSRSVLWPSAEIPVRPTLPPSEGEPGIPSAPVSLNSIVTEMTSLPLAAEIHAALAEYAVQLNGVSPGRIRRHPAPELYFTAAEEVERFLAGREDVYPEIPAVGSLALNISARLPAQLCEELFTHFSSLVSLEINIAAEQPVTSLHGVLQRAKACGLQHLVMCAAGSADPAVADSLPDALWQMDTLHSLELRNLCHISHIPEEIGSLTNLRFLRIEGENFPLRALPENLGVLANLERLELIDLVAVQTLPESIGNLRSLMSLYISNVPVKTLPAGLWQLSGLEHLILEDLRLTQIPEEIGNLTALKSLVLDGMSVMTQRMAAQTGPGITTLPESMGRLQQLTTLKLSWLPDLQELPQAISQLASLVNLNISSNPHIEHLPAEFAALTNLDSLIFNDVSYSGYTDYVKRT